MAPLGFLTLQLHNASSFPAYFAGLHGEIGRFSVNRFALLEFT